MPHRTTQPRNTPADRAAEMRRFRQRVYRLIAAVPAGRVATYGQIAALAGHARRARHVGRALTDTPEGVVLPWHRIINAQGRVATRSGEPERGGVRETRQQRLLEAEGVHFKSGRVDLVRYRWRPEEDGAALVLGRGE